MDSALFRLVIIQGSFYSATIYPYTLAAGHDP